MKTDSNGAIGILNGFHKKVSMRRKKNEIIGVEIEGYGWSEDVMQVENNFTEEGMDRILQSVERKGRTK